MAEFVIKLGRENLPKGLQLNRKFRKMKNIAKVCKKWLP
jgi:hypothetical protein